MTVKAVFCVVDLGEESSSPNVGQVRARCKGKILDGLGTGSAFDQDFDFNPEEPNINTQLAASVKTYLQNTHSISFSSGDSVIQLPSVL